VNFFGVNGTGNALDNTITGNLSGNTLNGEAGNDLLLGMGGADTLNGGVGQDTLDGGSGNDSMAGDTGNDVYIVDSASDIVTEYLLGGTDRVESSVTHTLGTWFENLTLTGTAAINGTGNAFGNTIIGNGANNLLSGLGANDSLEGAAGADTLDGGTGSDTMKGGSGNDRYIVDVATDLVTELANEGTDTVVAAVTYTLRANVENLDQFAAVGNVNGTGNASNNTMTGNNSNNTLLGLAGTDSFFASGGDDTIQGGDGTDTLRGGTGDDTLYAFDLATSDDGDVDTFVFDTAVTGADVDTIMRASFVAGSEVGDDRIHLENSIFTALRATGGIATVGTLDASMYQAGAGLNGAFAGAAVGIYHNTTTGQLYYNDSAAAGSVAFAVLNTATANGGAALDINEWVLI
jgi:Ca2+-binding RTX toxin-like protein